jgi:hypothetical protein
MKVSLNFKFKGNRKYVQGPDIIDAVIPYIRENYPGDITEFKYSAHQMLYSNADVVFGSAPEKELNSLISFQYEGDGTIYASVIENNLPVTESYEYDENPVQQKCLIGDKDVTVQEADLLYEKYSFSEVIVSMNKFYMQQKITDQGKWIITKIEYNSLQLIDEWKGKPLKLTVLKNLNNKLTKSAIYIDNLAAGFIYFSLI